LCLIFFFFLLTDTKDDHLMDHQKKCRRETALQHYGSEKTSKSNID